MRSDQIRLIDEADAGADVDVAIVHPAEAAAVPVEVHLRDDEPASAEHRLDMSGVSGAARALDARLEDHRRADGGLAANREAVLRRISWPGVRDTELHQRLALVAIPGVPRADAIDAGIGIAREVSEAIGGMARHRRPGVVAATGRGATGRALREGRR